MLNKSLFGAALMTAFAAARDCEMADTDGWCFDEVDFGEEVEEASEIEGTRIKMFVDDSNHITRELPPEPTFGSAVGCWDFHYHGESLNKFELKDDGTAVGHFKGSNLT